MLLAKNVCINKVYISDISCIYMCIYLYTLLIRRRGGQEFVGLLSQLMWVLLPIHLVSTGHWGRTGQFCFGMLKVHRQ